MNSDLRSGQPFQLHNASLVIHIGKEISVAMNNSDAIIIGVLTGYYKDSIIIETVLKQKILIPKSSIAYLKTSIAKKASSSFIPIKKNNPAVEEFDAVAEILTRVIFT
jgi:hypothetical protein